MPKLREFFECQKQMGIPNFPEEFGEREIWNTVFPLILNPPPI
jgi:hypothetical protein